MIRFDIIIPHLGVSPRLTNLCLNCLESIHKHSGEYRIILIDNASTEPMTEVLASLAKTPYLCLRYETNQGFVKAVNAGIRLATADYVVIMNNDTEAVTSWLAVLQEPLHGEVMACGPATTTKECWQGKRVRTKPFNPWIIPQTGMLAFFCTMFRREVFEKVGLLDESFGVGLGDDSDYCRRIHDAGYRLAYTPRIVIPHHHRSTFNTVYGIREVAKMKFVGVREFKEGVVKYLNEGSEIVVMKRKRPIARLTPVGKNSPEIILLEIGRVLSEAGVSKKEALKALDQARKKIYG